MSDINEIISQSAIDGLLKAAQAAQVLDSAITAINKSQSSLAEKTKMLNDTQKEAEKLTKEQTKTLADLDRQRKKAEDQLTRQNNKEAEQREIMDKEAKTMYDLQKQILALTAARNKLDITTKDGAKAAQEYNKRINENTEKIRANTDAASKQRMNIGNYKSALEGIPGPMGRAAGSAMAFGKQLWALVANPIVATIAALVAGLKLLYESFKSTDEGADLLEQGTSMLSASWKVITDRIGNVLTGNMKLKDSFSGVRDEILSTASAASNYAKTMDTISERTSLFISEEAQLKKEQAELTRVYKDATKTDEERRDALIRTIAIEEQLATFKQKNAAEIYRAELVRVAQSQTASDLTIDQIKAFVEMSTSAAENLKDNDPVYKAFWNTNVENVGALEQAYANLTNAESEYLEGTAKAFGKKTAFDKEIADRAVKAAEEANKKKAEMDAVAAARQAPLAQMTAIQVEQVVTDAHIEGIAMREQADIDSAAREYERLQKQKEDRLQIAQEYTQQVSAIGQTLLDFNQFLIDTEVQKMEQAKAYELQMAGDNAEKKAEIEKKYDKEASKLKAKQAKQDKASALFAAIIKTAQAVLSGLAYGPPLGYIFAALNAALGAVQIGVIASQPIPQFAKGTKKAPKGLAWIGERGQELIFGKDGVMMSPGQATLMNLKGGERILSNQDTKRLMAAAKGADDYYSRKLLDQMHADNLQLIETVKNKPVLHIDRKGNRISERPGFRTYLDRKL